MPKGTHTIHNLNIFYDIMTIISNHLFNFAGSPRELVLREKVGRSVIVGEDWSHFTFTPPQVPGVRLDYKYRVICDADYFGPGCSVVCRPRDDELGHYRCTENGTKACLDGWTGPYCDKGEAWIGFPYLFW